MRGTYIPLGSGASEPGEEEAGCLLALHRDRTYPVEALWEHEYSCLREGSPGSPSSFLALLALGGLLLLALVHGEARVRVLMLLLPLLLLLLTALLLFG